MYEITGQPESLGPLSCKAFVRELCHPDDAQALITHYTETMQTRGRLPFGFSNPAYQ
jgi:hypothetical protein